MIDLKRALAIRGAAPDVSTKPLVPVYSCAREVLAAGSIVVLYLLCGFARGWIDPSASTAPPASPPAAAVTEPARTDTAVLTTGAAGMPVLPPAGPLHGRQALREMARRVARRHGVDEDLVLAVIESESSFDPYAVSPRGALGLMQLMPATAASLGVENAFDPRENVDGGVRYLKELLDRYDGKVRPALAAYRGERLAAESESP